MASRRRPAAQPAASVPMPTAEGVAVEALASPALARLMIWLSPAFPVGGYSYSHGLEWAVAEGGIADRLALLQWVEDVLVHGAGRSDVILLAEAWRAVAAGDGRRLGQATELAGALVPSAERRLETLAQGRAFLDAVQAVWPLPLLDALWVQDAEVAYPVAVGACAAAHGLPLVASALAFCQAFAAALVSAGVRLIPLGQTDGLRVLAQLEAVIPPLVVTALRAGLADVGGAALGADIASMRHETQSARLFRS
jgi:urease accessory protein